MHSAHHPTSSHYQLRNMVACRDQLHLVYADGLCGRVFSTKPYLSTRSCIIDLSASNNTTAYAEPVKISSLGLSTDPHRNIVAIGGIDGEFVVKNLELE